MILPFLYAKHIKDWPPKDSRQAIPSARTGPSCRATWPPPSTSPSRWGDDGRPICPSGMVVLPSGND